MSLARRLLPVAGPLGIAAALAVITSLGDGEPTAVRAPVYSEHPRMHGPDAALERELDDGLRMFCP